MYQLISYILFAFSSHVVQKVYFKMAGFMTGISNIMLCFII
jgi:hypothetical protein